MFGFVMGSPSTTSQGIGRKTPHFQRMNKGFLLDQLATRGVDQKHAFFHQTENIAAKEMKVAFVKGAIQGNDVAVFNKRLKLIGLSTPFPDFQGFK